MTTPRYDPATLNQAADALAASWNRMPDLTAMAAADADNPTRNPFLPEEDEHCAQLFATPEDFVHDSFQSDEEEEGLRCVTGELKATGERAAFAYCFASARFTAESAAEWLSTREITPAKFDPAKDATYRQITASAARLDVAARKPSHPASVTFSGGPVTISPPEPTR